MHFFFTRLFSNREVMSKKKKNSLHRTGTLSLAGTIFLRFSGALLLCFNFSNSSTA